MDVVELAERLKDHGEILQYIPDSLCSRPQVKSVLYDSRKAAGSDGGAIFACVKGDRVDGHDFARCAIADGAAALICERRIELDVPQFIVPDARSAMGAFAACINGHPSDSLTMIGVTGTNGKTTTAYLIRSIMRQTGLRTGMIGTIVYDDSIDESPADRTTPEGPDLQDILRRMVDNGAECCVMEASSHGLHQGRSNGCRFDRAAFSNLTQEHLEYHSDMEHYFEAKRLLFSRYMKDEWMGTANADDEFGRRLIAEFGDRMSGFSLSRNADVDYKASVFREGIHGTGIELSFPDGEAIRIESPLLGMYNVSNVLEAASIADTLCVDRRDIALGIEGCSRVPGRLERYQLRGGAAVFIDYAHSPDGIKQVLSSLRPLTKDRLIIIWGAGGDRTPLKRPVAGRIMAELADMVIITTDNPRSEDPMSIARDVEKGAIDGGGADRCRIILDRGEAIDHALDSADAGDVVVIAGKGPERAIQYADRTVPFSDSEAVLKWARMRGIEVM